VASIGFFDRLTLSSFVCFEVNPVGKPCAANPHARFDERGWETGLYATAPVLDSTGGKIFRFNFMDLTIALDM
jgi:hypothetical protein